MRAMRAPAAGLGSAAVAVLLALVWYDDGRTARRGPLVLLPRGEDIPDSVSGLAWVRLAVVLAGLAAVVGLAAAAHPRRRPTWGPAVLHALAAVATGLAAWRLAGRATPAVAATAVVLAGTALLWTLARLSPTPEPAADPVGRAGLVVAGAVVVVTAVVAPVGGHWWAYGRLVERTTTDAAAPADDPSGPSRPGAVRWHRPALDALPLGRYVLLRERQPGRYPGVVVVEAATGAERWSYRHTDASLGLTGDPTTDTVVLTLNRDGAAELRAFDLPTGRPLWSRRDAGEVVGPDPRFLAGEVVSPPGVLLLLDRRATRLRALDPRTGAERWQRAVDRECASSAGFVRAGDVVVQTSLCRRPTVPAFRLDTGADAWTATLGPDPVRSRGVNRPAVLVGGAVVLSVLDEEKGTLVALEPDTGRERWRRPARPGVRPATVVGGRLVLAEVDEAERLVAVALDPATGRPAWTTVLPRQPRPGRSEELVVGSDGTRWYLLAGVQPGGPGTTWLTVLDAAGRPLGAGELAGCPRECTGGQVRPAESVVLAAAGGTLVVLPSSFGTDREVVGIGDGPAFSAPQAAQP